MSLWSPPPRERGVELLDDPEASDDDRAAAMQDLARSNRLFGGTDAVRAAMRDVWPTLPRNATLLDVGTGMGDIPRALCLAATSVGAGLRTVGVDHSPFQVTLARPHLDHAVAGSALAIPFADGAVDVVTCSQLLHHFFDEEPKRLIAEMHRVSRDWVVISDLYRSRIAGKSFQLAAWVLGFNIVTRQDGVQSVKRGFTADELDRLVFEATGVRPTIRHSRFWRLTATWRKSPVR
jgi:ubiquinone/menaquinone biosynthesis C-methylase UbiE